MNKPTAPEVNFENIPEELKELDRWVLWNYEYRPKEKKPWTKVPKQGKNGWNASSSNSKTWNSFDIIKRLYETGKYDGVGIAVYEGDITAIDVDDCIDGNGELLELGAEMVNVFDSYTEISPSGTGLRILVKGSKPGRRENNKNGLEMYDQQTNGRYVTITGRVWGMLPKPIEDRQEEINRIYNKHMKKADDDKPVEDVLLWSEPTEDDAAVMQAIGNSKNRYNFESYYNDGYPDNADQSEIDYSMACILAETTRDPQQIERIMRNSALKRDKWDNHKDYLKKFTIAKALKNTKLLNDPAADFDQQQERPPEPETVSVADYIESGFLKEMQQNRDAVPVSTGFKKLDDILSGGFYEGLFVIGGLPATGKTAFMLQLANTIAEQGTPVLYATLEVSAYELTARSISARMAEDGQRRAYISIMRGHVSEDILKPYFNDYSTTRGKNLYIKQAFFGMNATEIGKEAEKIQLKTGMTPLIIVDYLQALKPEGKFTTDKERVDQTITTLKGISDQLHTTVVVLSSFNRQNGYKVSMKSFKESGSIEYTADFLAGLEPVIPDEDDDGTVQQGNSLLAPVRLKVLKNRRGPDGLNMAMDFLKPCSVFEETGPKHYGPVTEESKRKKAR